jgi:hypothetical protein
MLFSRKVLIHPQHPPLQWNLSGIIVEQSTEKSNLAAKGSGYRPRDEKFCGCFFEKHFNSIFYIVPRRLFFAAPQRISITSSPNYYQKNQRFTTRKNQEEHGPDVM